MSWVSVGVPDDFGLLTMKRLLRTQWADGMNRTGRKTFRLGSLGGRQSGFRQGQRLNIQRLAPRGSLSGNRNPPRKEALADDFSPGPGLPGTDLLAPCLASLDELEFFTLIQSLDRFSQQPKGSVSPNRLMGRGWTDSAGARLTYGW